MIGHTKERQRHPRLCEATSRKLVGISTQRHVLILSETRTLAICAGVGHQTPPITFSLHDLVKLFPNARCLELKWYHKLAGTRLELAPLPPDAAVAKLTSFTDLQIVVCKQRMADKGFGSAELAMLLGQLSLPNVQKLSLWLELVYFGDDAKDKTWRDL